MADPVVLIGMGMAGEGLTVVGLYPTVEAAGDAVRGGRVPVGMFYSVMTPKMGECTSTRKVPPFPCVTTIAREGLLK